MKYKNYIIGLIILLIFMPALVSKGDSVNGGVWNMSASNSSGIEEEVDTLQTVTDRGATTTNNIATGNITVNNGGKVGATTSNWVFDDTGDDISTSARVGINTTAPGTDLDINGNALIRSGYAQYFSSSNNTIRSTGSNILIKTNGTDAVVIDPDQNIKFNAHAGFALQTVSYNSTATTVNWANGNKAKLTFGAGNIGTLAFSDPANSGSVQLIIVQDGTGSRTVTAWDTEIKWAGGTAPELSTAAGAIDIISCLYDGTAYYCSASLDFI